MNNMEEARLNTMITVFGVIILIIGFVGITYSIMTSNDVTAFMFGAVIGAAISLLLGTFLGGV